MTDEEFVIRELSNAIASMSMCIPYLEGMKGKISTEIIDLIDDINKFSVSY